MSTAQELDIINIGGLEVPVVTYKSLRVVTTELLAQAFGTDINNIQKNYAVNKDRFVEGKHYFKIVGDELKEFATYLKSVTNFSMVRNLTLWTERGVARHAKILETDEAWEVYEKLEDHYFGDHENLGQRTDQSRFWDKATHAAINRRAHSMMGSQFDKVKRDLYDLIRKNATGLSGQDLVAYIMTCPLPDQSQPAFPYTPRVHDFSCLTKEEAIVAFFTDWEVGQIKHVPLLPTRSGSAFLLYTLWCAKHCLIPVGKTYFGDTMQMRTNFVRLPFGAYRYQWEVKYRSGEYIVLPPGYQENAVLNLNTQELEHMLAQAQQNISQYVGS